MALTPAEEERLVLDALRAVVQRQGYGATAAQVRVQVAQQRWTPAQVSRVLGRLKGQGKVELGAIGRLWVAVEGEGQR